MSPRLCQTCKHVTYPDKWCECDPRDQIFEFLLEECVYLQPDDTIPAPEDTP